MVVSSQQKIYKSAKRKLNNIQAISAELFLKNQIKLFIYKFLTFNIHL